MPWTITDAALRQYAALRGVPLAEAAPALEAVCERCAADLVPTAQDNGLLRYRAGRSDGRVRLLVTEAGELVAVLPSSARGRAGG